MGIKNFYRKSVLRNFYSIDLNSVEKAVADDSVDNKYAPAFKASLIYGLLAFPAVIFFDTLLLVTVLVPVTMVSGTAWFAISLVNVKKKFENFGNELTTDMYRSFITSLIILLLLVIFSLNSFIFEPIISLGISYPLIKYSAGIMGSVIVGKIIYDIFLGSTKYDVNDAMLAGQNEAAEKYFKRALSLLNKCSDFLRSGSSPQVATYYIGLAFYEVFSYAMQVKGFNKNFAFLIQESAEMKADTTIEWNDTKLKIIHFTEEFLKACTNISSERTQKSYRNIQGELKSIIIQVNEDPSVTQVRVAVILEEIEELLAGQGESLFIKRREVEKKWLVQDLKSVGDIEIYEKHEIKQGYIEISDTYELRVRSRSGIYTKTSKTDHPSGYREEIEEYITKEEFDKYWEKTKNRRIEKIRYMIPYKGLVIELDIFSGKNTGLILAEIDFPDEEAVSSVSVPSWFGEDVTTNKSYKNKNLAG